MGRPYDSFHVGAAALPRCGGRCLSTGNHGAVDLGSDPSNNRRFLPRSPWPRKRVQTCRRRRRLQPGEMEARSNQLGFNDFVGGAAPGTNQNGRRGHLSGREIACRPWRLLRRPVEVLALPQKKLLFQRQPKCRLRRIGRRGKVHL